jgi:hypothetical protein
LGRFDLMPLFDGVVLLDGDEVPVLFAVEEDRIRLSSGGVEIGEWQEGTYEITPTDGDLFLVSADGDTVAFRPSRPLAFSRAIGVEIEAEAEPKPEPVAMSADTHADEAPGAAAPPPRPITRALFITLSGVTALLGLWALIALIGLI